jgi:hypothetical protein
MGLGRTAPHRTRAAYLRALAALPLLARAPRTPAPVPLTVLATATAAGRELAFCTFTASPRLWVACNTAAPVPFGFLTGLTSGEPDLWISDYAHEAWIREADHTEQIKTAAFDIWEQHIRTCSG